MKPTIRFPWDIIILTALIVAFGIIINTFSPLGWFSYWLGAGMGIIAFGVALSFIDVPDFIKYKEE
jgi:uncharacterized membrane protein YdfJ with MMPL/SSD domain